MFRPKQAFREIEGQYDAEGLKRTMDRLRVAHMADLAVEYETADLYELAEERQWLRQVAPGRYEISVSDEQPRRTEPQARLRG